MTFYGQFAGVSSFVLILDSVMARRFSGNRLRICLPMRVANCMGLNCRDRQSRYLFRSNEKSVQDSCRQALLGGVGKFEPVSGSGEMDHVKEAVGQLIIAVGDAPLILRWPNMRSMQLYCR